MRVLLAGATGAIGRPLIRGLKQHGHSVFGLVRSAESARMLTEMGAEAVIGDALDAASVRAAIARVCPDADGRGHFDRRTSESAVKPLFKK
jgi:uncharacterized protein YbjT (DUF2867 family)